MMSNEELIKAQDEDIKNLLARIKDLEAASKSNPDNVILSTADCPYHFKENYFYIGSSWNYVYRVHLMYVLYNQYRKEYEWAFKITGTFYRGRGFDQNSGKRHLKQVLSWVEAVDKLDAKITKDSFKGINVSDLLEIKDFLMNNQDMNNNEAYNLSQQVR